MPPRVPIEPALLTWACERRGLEPHQLAARFPGLQAWIDGEKAPTLKQLEAFAKATYTPVGYLFLAEPPEERVPIPDMRTVGDRPIGRPSPDLLDTIHLCQQRQDWYLDHARSMGEQPLDFVGSIQVGADIQRTAGIMRAALRLDQAGPHQARNPGEGLGRLVALAEDLGVLVMTSGIVGSNTSRTLDPREFRGFALCDPIAPLVFINGADAKAAQLFTLAHELAHLWIGVSALDDVSAAHQSSIASERWCNQVAAELLVPLARLREELDSSATLETEARRLARSFQVSSLVIIRRLLDLGVLDRQAMWELYQAELARLSARKPSGGGGNFYLSQRARVGRRFAQAVYESTWEGRSSFTEAFRLLNVSRMATFRKLGTAVGMDL